MTCRHRLYAATRTEPAEYCDQPAIDGEFCADHQPPDDWWERSTAWRTA